MKFSKLVNLSLYLPFAVLFAAMSGCVSPQKTESPPVNILVSNTLPLVQVTITNASSFPAGLDIELFPETQTNLSKLLEMVANHSNSVPVVINSNLHTVSVSPLLTNELNIASPLSISFSSDILTNLGGIITAGQNTGSSFGKMLLGAVFTLLGGIVTALFARRSLAKNVLIAMKNEEASIHDTYRDNLQKELRRIQQPDGKVVPARAYNCKAALTVNWFPIFTANAGNIGLLRTAHMTAIIETHAAMKSLIESYQLNNTLLKEAETNNFKINSDGTVPSPPVTGDTDYDLYRRLLDRAEEIAASDTIYENKRQTLVKINIPKLYLF